MFRTGVGAGAGAGRINGEGYRFDGEVADVGKDGYRAGDNSPVSPAELEATHALIRDLFKTRFKSFRHAYRVLDENHSGRINKIEALRMLLIFNLSDVREKAVAKLVELMDSTGKGIQFHDFCRWMMSEKASDLAR